MNLRPIIIFLILINFLFLGSLQSQPWAEVSSDVSPNFYRMKVAGDALLENVKTQKGKGFKAFKRWENYWENRVFADGSFPPANLIQKNWEAYQIEKTLSAVIPGSAWSSLGPNISSGGYAGIGRINRITVHPTNSNIIFACTAGGGLWKTTNGGSSWVPLTDQLASIGTSGLVINPIDPNIMYLATGDCDGADTYSYGVLKTTDGGLTWNPTGLTFTSGIVIYKLQPHASDPNILFAGTNTGLFRTSNGGSTWTKVVSSGQFYDIESLVGTNNMVAVTKGGFYRSTDSGITWTLVTSIASTGRIALAVSAANPDFVAALVSNTSNGFKGFYASLDGGLTYSLRSSTPNLMGWEVTGNDSGGQAWYDICVAVSPIDIDQIFVGGINTWKSNDGGTTWSIVTNWYSTSTLPAKHADNHDIIYQNSTTLYNANDGGIYKSINSGATWTDISNGMSISQLYRVSASQTDTRIIAGLQDNGTKLRGISGTWTDEIGGDGMDCAIDPINASYMYGTLYYGDIQRSSNGGTSWSSITPSTGTDGDWVSPVVLDPLNPSIIYLGYKDLKKSIDRGTTWTTITSGQTGGKFISNIAISPSNTQIIYISWGSSMSMTLDGGLNWSSITLPISSTIASILVDPNNANNIYVTYSNFTAGSKVYFSNNGGASWINFSGTLPNLPANKIIYQSGSNGALYLGMDVGVYYRDNTQSDWSLYNVGLPNVEIFDLEIRYSDKKLIAATYGRGLWESPLYDGGSISTPTISSFTPTSASTGQVVTITGTNFTGATAVSFGGTPATSFSVVSATNITATVAGGTTGNVSVTTSGGVATRAGFTYVVVTPAPTISSFTPISASIGQVVTITGTNFTGATAVSFGGTPATSFTVVSATTITATVASGTTGNVSVTTSGGVATRAGFTYVVVTPAPTISSFTPTSASTGQVVTITGTNFTGATAVSFGGTPATSFTVVSATSITATVAGGSTGNVSVTTSGGVATRAGFTYVVVTPAPTISSFTPTSASTGQIVTITGTNFTGATAVSFGGTPATTFTVVSATSITATVASGTTGNVSVTTSVGVATRAGFTYVVVTPAPTISSFTPTSASTGQVVTITGTNFTGATAVSFGGTPATSFTVVSATSITATVAGGTTGNVSVTTSGGVATRAGFTYVVVTPAPTISSFTPTSASTGQIVTITGTNFTGATAVSFGGTPATSFTVVSATSITATVAGGTTGNVSVTTSGGVATRAGFTYVVVTPAPTISSFTPTSASTGQVVTITGTNFTGATAVSFGGTPATSFTVVSATSITATVAGGTTGNVSVTTSGGVATRAGFTYVVVTPAPTISSFTPTSASTGQVVTITGTNFTGATAVSFGGTPATSFTVVSATRINATIGLGSSGMIKVTNANGTSTVPGFLYIIVPGITQISPIKAIPGSTITITGSGFSTNKTANVVWIGATKSGIVSSSSTTISTTVPLGATFDYIRILNNETKLTAQSNSFFVSSFSPSRDSINLSDISPKIDLVSAAGPEDIRLSDLDGDGKPDIILANYSAGSISVFKNTSTIGNIQVSNFVRNDFNSGTNPCFISVADLDNDGKQDLIVANQSENTISIFKNISTSNGLAFNAPIKLSTPSTPIGLGIGDFDKNGWLDIASVNHGQNTVSIFANNGIFNSISIANFGTRFNLAAGLNPITIDVADLDADGKQDIVIGNYGSATVSIYKNIFTSGTLNSSSFGTKIDFSVGNNPGYLKLGDIDSDGKLDIVVLSEKANSVGILKNTSTTGILNLSSFATRLNFKTGSTPYYISLGDVKGNGKLDILITNYLDGTVTLWQNKSSSGSISSSSFFKRLDFPVGTKPFACLLGDIDGDSRTDILVSNSESNTLSILKNVGGSQMIVSPVQTTLPATGGSITANISTNTTWEVNSNATWLIPVVTNGKNSGSIRVNFSSNNGAPRKGIVSFTGNGLTKTMEVSQAGKPGIVNLNNEYIDISNSLIENLKSENSQMNLDIFPNPSNGFIQLTIKFDDLESNGNVIVQDLQGRIIKRLNHLRTGNYIIDLTNEPDGPYLISLTNLNSSKTLYKHFIKNK